MKMQKIGIDELKMAEYNPRKNLTEKDPEYVKIKNSSRIDEKVLDLFGGSGSTLIAAEQSKRTCYMMELDPKYCDVIVKRWETLTNRKAKLEDR